MKNLLSIVAILLAVVGLASAQSAQPVEVSMVQLIATPERYDGKLVRVSGFLWTEFEGNALYLHKEDKDRLLFKNGLWIDVTGASGASADQLRGKYVIVKAVFDATMHGHMGLWSGALLRLQQIEELKP